MSEPFKHQYLTRKGRSMPRTPRRLSAIVSLACSLVVTGGCGAGDASNVSGPPKLASASQLTATVDFTRLPHPAGATFGQLRPTHVTAEVTGTVKEITERYLQMLAEQDCALSREANAKTVTDEYAQVALAGKDGVRLSMSVSPLGSGKAQVQLINHGAFDVRHLGKPADADVLFASPTLVSHVTPASVADTAAAVATILKKDGWQEYSPLHSQRIDMPTLQQRFYRQRGNALDVSVTEAPAQGGKSVISYQVLALSHELPTTADAVDVAFDDAKGELRCRVPRPMGGVAEDLRQLFVAAGLADTPTEKPTPERIALRFEAPNGDVVMVSVTPSDEGPAKVSMVTVPAAVMEKLRKAEAGDRAAGEPTAEAPY